MPSGDGTASALLTLEALAGGDLADRAAMQKLPQRLVNVTVSDRGALDGATAVWDAVDGRVGQALEGRGRVLIRPSGTEPLVRVMVEAPEQAECDDDHRAPGGGGRRDWKLGYLQQRELPSSTSHVRHHRIHGIAPLPGDPPGRAPGAGVPRL